MTNGHMQVWLFLLILVILIRWYDWIMSLQVDRKLRNNESETKSKYKGRALCSSHWFIQYALIK